MALSADSTSARDAVSLALYESPYANVTDRQQANVNAALEDALLELVSVADCFGETAAPDQWAMWLHRLAAVLGATGGRPDTIREHQALADRARIRCLADYTPSAYSASNTYGDFTLQNIRIQVRSRLAQMDVPISTPVFDQHFQDVLSEIWHDKPWSFRREPATITIADDGTVTAVDPGSNTIDFTRVETFRLYYEDTSRSYLDWIDADSMANFTALGTNAGRPTHFRVRRNGDALEWQFYPEPDQAYTVRAEVTTDGPPSITTPNVTADLSVIPSPVRPILLELLVLKVRLAKNHAGVAQAYALTQERLHARLASLDSAGTVEQENMVPRNVRDDPSWESGYSRSSDYYVLGE